MEVPCFYAFYCVHGSTPEGQFCKKVTKKSETS